MDVGQRSTYQAGVPVSNLLAAGTGAALECGAGSPRDTKRGKGGAPAEESRSPDSRRKYVLGGAWSMVHLHIQYTSIPCSV